jgi:autotransporter-associated beta strand protein
MNKPSASYRVSLPWLWQHPKTSLVTFICRWLAVVTLGFFATSAFATDFSWDAGTANTGTGSGNWDISAANNWWNGSSDVSWPQNNTTAPTTGAIFGGADGTYAINVASQIAVTNIIFNNSGYTLSGSGIYFSTNAAAGATTQPIGVNVADGKTASFNVNVAGYNNSAFAGPVFREGVGSTLNIGGSMGGLQPFFYGPGTNNITAATFGSSVTIIHGPVVYNGGGNWNVGNSLLVGYVNGPTYFGTANTAPGSITFNGGTMTDGANKIVLGRSGGTGTFTLNAGTVNFWSAGSGDNGNANSLIAIPNNDAGLNHGTLIVNGGTFNIGGPASVTAARDQIQMMSGGGANGATAFFTQTGGIVNDWGGILIGNTGSSTYTATCTAAITNSGGSLFIGSYGIVKGLTFPTVIKISLSGGIVGALANWSTTLPMNLDTLNGNITFQCADSGATAHNITLSGALTGPGGFTKTGSGMLKLSGANNFAGSTVVSNGTLQMVTGTLPIASGANIVDGSAGGSPIESIDVLNTGQYWTNSGDLTYAAGTMTADFNYDNGFQPSTVTAPLQVSGSVNFTATPSVTIEGSAIPIGIYPLIKYGGSVTGTMPTAPTSLPAGATATISNSPAAKTIYLVVTGSIVVPGYVWGVGSGAWDFTTANWKHLSGPLTSYVDGNLAQFDDTMMPGPFSFIVTNNGTVNPTGITVSTTNAYTLKGNGTIAGSGGVTMASSGTLTMAGTNTYTGGTTVKAGQLNINYGGDGSLNSAIGTGPLTNDLSAKIDNTSGHSVTLLTPIAQYWNDDWTFVGSTNFNTGPGAVTLGNNNVILTVVSNNLEVDGAISDNGSNFRLTKQGNGSLTLKGSGNNYGGGFELFSGQVNLGDASSCGYGVFTIDGGSIDNYSGGDLTLSSISYVWQGSFSYLGTSNNLDFGAGTIAASGGGNFSVNVVTNTLITEGNIIPGNNVLHKTGQGTWDITGAGSTAQNLNLSVDEGTVKLDKAAGPSINGTTIGLLVQSNALAVITGSDGNQISDNIAVTLSTGGVLDLYGNSETVGQLATTNGVLRNSLAGGTSTLTAGPMTLTGTSCVFDVSDSVASLTVTATDVTGSGSLVKTGLGLLNLSTNSYTGNTTISNGGLVLNFPNIATNSTITVNTNATLGTNGVLNLNFPNGETNTVAALVLGGVSKPAGVYNATTDPLYITGSGSLQIASPINPLPGLIQFSVSGSTLALSWPTNLGWILQDQTNALSVGLVVNSNAWFDISGSALVTSTNITINPANPTMFFRLRSP